MTAEREDSDCCRWNVWPERKRHDSHATDIGIDPVVARRESGGAFIATPRNSGMRDSNGRSADIAKEESNSFIATSTEPLWTERWLVTHGGVRLAPNAKAVDRHKPEKAMNLESDQFKRREAEWSAHPEPCPRFEGTIRLQTRNCTQRKAVARALGWDLDWLCELRQLLCHEPQVRGMGHNQFGEELENQATLQWAPDRTS